MRISLCESCRRRPECLKEETLKDDKCKDYEPLSIEAQLEREEFVNAMCVGGCPKCGSENATDCENEPSIEDNTVGACLECRTHWCLECGYVFKEGAMTCPHWGFCDACHAKEGYLTSDEFVDKVCPTCAHFDEGCQMDEPSECKKGDDFMCPYRMDISDCPKLGRHLEELG